MARFGLQNAAERSISADSIRRVLDERWQSGFSEKIKDAACICLGYECWEEFKTKRASSSVANLPVVINQFRIVSIIPHPEAVQDWWQNQRIELVENPTRKRQWWWAIGLLLLLIGATEPMAVTTTGELTARLLPINWSACSSGCSRKAIAITPAW